MPSTWQESAGTRCTVCRNEVALTLYFLKDQVLLLMTVNAFGVVLSTVSVTVHKVWSVITRILGQRYIKMPNTEQEMKNLVQGMENKYGFSQTFGYIDGTHIQIVQPKENRHDNFSYKQKHTLNVQAVYDWRGLFIDVQVKWPGSVHYGRAFATSRINQLLKEQQLPILYKERLLGFDKIPVTLLEDPAYPLLRYCMKMFSHCHNNEEVIFNTMLGIAPMCIWETESQMSMLTGSLFAV